MTQASPKKRIVVAAGILERPDGAVLLGQRPEGKPWPGWWELPGGKLEPGESVLEALRRELHEELGIEVTEAHYWVRHEHEYPLSHVVLHFVRVTGWQGEPVGRESQALCWVHRMAARADLTPLTPLPDHPGQSPEETIGLSLIPSSPSYSPKPTPATRARSESGSEPCTPLSGLENTELAPHTAVFAGWLLPASFAPLRWLDLPKRLVRWTPDEQALAPALTEGDAVILRLAQGDPLAESSLSRLQIHAAELFTKGVCVLLDSTHPVTWLASLGAHGYHLRPEHHDRLGSMKPEQMPHGGPWIGLEVAHAQDLEVARSVHADYVVLLDPHLTPPEQVDRPAYWAGRANDGQAQAGVLVS